LHFQHHIKSVEQRQVLFELEIGRCYFVETDIDLFNFFTDIWPFSEIQLATDILKFAN